MKIFVYAAAFAALTSGATLAQQTAAQKRTETITLQKFVAAAKAKIVDGLKDPESARFKNLYVSRHTRQDDGTSELMLCGEINAKNAHGGYVGFAPFISSVGAMVYMGDQIGALIPEYCGNKIADVR